MEKVCGYGRWLIEYPILDVDLITLLQFRNDPVNLVGDIPCNTFSFQPIGCTLAYIQPQVI